MGNPIFKETPKKIRPPTRDEITLSFDDGYAAGRMSAVITPRRSAMIYLPMTPSTPTPASNNVLQHL